MWPLFVRLTEIGKTILCSVNGKFTFILISLCNMLQRCFSCFFILYYIAFGFEIRSICNVFNESTTWSHQQMYAAVHVPHCPPPSPTLTSPSPTHYSTDHILAHKPRVTLPQLSQRESATSAVRSLSIIHNVNLTNVLTHWLSLLITQKDFSMSGPGLRLTSKERWPKASADPQQSNQEKGM